MKSAKLSVILLILFAVAFVSRCQKDDNNCSSCPPPTVGTPYELEVPDGFPQPFIPADNPMTEEGVELGRHLFYDKRLSGDLSMSCGSCHIQGLAFGDFPIEPTSTGIAGIKGRRNAMPLFNLAWQEYFFWDGRAGSLEEQSLHPIVDPLELNTDLQTVLSRLETDSVYPGMFKAAFGDSKITEDRLAKAIAQFERSIVSANSEFDKVKRLGGPYNLFDEEAKNRGYNMFITEEGDCFHCHSVGNYMFGAYAGLEEDVQFKNNGVRTQEELDAAGADKGREEVTMNPNDRGKFKVPSLRNIEYSGLYMHDGSMSLNEVIEFYNSGGNPSTTVDSANMMFLGRGHNWTTQQKADLVAFLSTLTDYEFLENPAYSDPFQQ